MSINLASGHRARISRGAKGFFSYAIATAMMVLALSLTPSAVMADGGLESQKGGLFHRKGWVHPEIYRKRQSAKAKQLQKAASKLGAPIARVPARKTSAGKAQVKRSSQKAAARLKRNRRAATRKRARLALAAAKRRIPQQAIKRRERKINRSAGRRSKGRAKGVKVASLGAAAVAVPTRKAKQARRGSITGGGARVQWAANSRCVPGRLKAAINYVARNFGRVRVNSTCRSRRRNRRVGGASRSWHLLGKAADIRVFGNIRKTARYLRSVVGGYKHYGGGLFHIDTGPRRSW